MQQDLNDLAESIKTNGILQPLTVRLNKENKYVTIQGVKYKVRCQLPERLELSGHADSTQLFKLLTQSFNQKKLKNIIVVHGGQEEREYIVQGLKERDTYNNKNIVTVEENELLRF